MAITAHLVGSDALVWSAEDVDLLRTKWHIVGNLVGALPEKPMQNLQFSLPLLLLPEEVSLLLHKGVLKVHQETPQEALQQGSPQQQWSSGDEQMLRDVVFRDLWGKGYYLTSGLKYGGDFLVYPDLPSKTHSSHIAIVLPWEQPQNTLVSLARVATKVKKNILLCSTDREHVAYFTMEWAGIT